jgi:hypothetical protein
VQAASSGSVRSSALRRTPPRARRTNYASPAASREGVGGAAIAIDPAQIEGVFRFPLMQSRAGFTGLGNPLNVGKAVSLTKAQFRHCFGNAIEQAESDAPFDK